MYVYCVYPVISKSPKTTAKLSETSVFLIVFIGVICDVSTYTVISNLPCDFFLPNKLCKFLISIWNVDFYFRVIIWDILLASGPHSALQVIGLSWEHIYFIYWYRFTIVYHFIYCSFKFLVGTIIYMNLFTHTFCIFWMVWQILHCNLWLVF